MAPKPAKGSGKKNDAAAGNKNWEAALTKELFAEVCSLLRALALYFQFMTLI